MLFFWLWRDSGGVCGVKVGFYVGELYFEIGRLICFVLCFIKLEGGDEIVFICYVCFLEDLIDLLMVGLRWVDFGSVVLEGGCWFIWLGVDFF